MQHRLLCQDAVSLGACEELIVLHRALSVVGYRAGVFSTTIYDVALADPRLLIPLVSVHFIHVDSACLMCCY